MARKRYKQVPVTEFIKEIDGLRQAVEGLLYALNANPEAAYVVAAYILGKSATRVDNRNLQTMQSLAGNALAAGLIDGSGFEDEPEKPRKTSLRKDAIVKAAEDLLRGTS